MPDILDDDIMAAYLIEAKEHIETAEQALLEVEKQGEDFDICLINEVFRGVHTVKGGASFYGLDNINTLSHELESILDLMRNSKLKPTPPIIDEILLSIDCLRTFINDPASSNESNITPLLEGLKNSIENNPEKKVKEQKIEPPSSPEKKTDKIKITDMSHKKNESSLHRVRVSTEDHTVEFECDYEELQKKKKEGSFFYFIFTDLIKDCHNKNRTPLDLIEKATFVGEIITSSFQLDLITETDGIPSGMPVYLLYQSPLEAEHLERVLDLSKENICEWREEKELKEPIEEEATPLQKTSLLPVKQEKTDLENSGKELISEKTSLELPGIKEHKEKKSETSLRIDIKLLDKLMSLAGELVLSRNQLMQLLTRNDPDGINHISQRINLITTELQENIMRTRMQPVGNVFNKFPRIVRDLSRNQGKEVKLIIKGEEVELDKNIVENMSDPLTHLIRNAIDHGLETPEERLGYGKEPEGKLILCAYHESGQVNIDIIDDGKGIDINKIKAKALEKGIIDCKKADLMSERDVLNLIFLPGFSTASKITGISGRGVGMDVVKTSFEKIGGTVDIQSEPGKGTTINIKLPLTLAIIPSLIVRCKNEPFAIPQMNLVELVKIKGGDVKEKIENIHGIEVFRLRGKLLPLLNLGSILYPDELPVRRNGNNINIIVLSSGNMKYGLIVDGLNDSEEIVVKPLGKHLKECKCYAGATIMGDGKVALILDIQGIANYCGLSTEEEMESLEELVEKEKRALEDIQSILIFNNGTLEQFGISLSLISRIDRVAYSEIEHMGGRDLIKYRGKSLPVIKIEKYLPVEEPPAQDFIYVLLFKIKGREIGLIARNIVDTKDFKFEIDDATLKQPGILGSCIIENLTTLFLDIFQIVEMAEPSWFKEREEIVIENNKKPSILLAEDSNFFRSHVKNYLESEGYEVIEAVQGKEGFEKLCNNRVDLVITDIEMPVMNGYEMTKKIKSDSRFKHLPVIALTAMAGDEDIKKGIEAGVDEYQIKLERESLLDSVATLLSKKIADYV